MKKIWKKIARVVLALGIGLIMALSSAKVKASTSSVIQKVTTKNCKKNVTPEEWNQKEIKAYQFDTEEEATVYLLTGGIKYYNKNFKADNQLVKIMVMDDGYLNFSLECGGKSKIYLYDSNMKIKTQGTASEGIEYMTRVKAGDVFYTRIPKGQEAYLASWVLKDSFGKLSQNKTYIQKGTGSYTYHEFKVKDRALVNFEIDSVYQKGDTSVKIEKKKNGKWEKIGSTGKVKGGKSSDDQICYALSGGEYRLCLKSPSSQAVSVSYEKESYKKKAVVYKKSKAKNIKNEDGTDEIYTQNEKASRWYKITVPSKKVRYVLNFESGTMTGGFDFTVYKKGRKKSIKAIKVRKFNEKTVKLPKGKATYYIKVSKNGKSTNGYYGLSFFKWQKGN